MPSFGVVGFFSDDFGEFVERFDQAEVWRGFGSEFVVSAADVLDESMAFDNDRGSSVAFESAHRPEPSFQSAVVTLDAIVLMLLGVVEGLRD